MIQNTQQVTGVQTIGFGDHPDLRFTPPTFNIDVTGQTVIRLPFTVTAEAGTPPRATGADIYWGLVRIGSGSIQITGNATPTFLFFANQDTVSVPNNVNSAPVEFTVTSVNGFIGQVDITNQTDGEVQEVPIVDPFNVYVTPTPPAKFTRRFIRFDGTTPLHVTYTATSGTITKTLTITVNHP